MSLPWRFTTADDYVQGTIDRLNGTTTSTATTTSLNIGKYYLAGNDLTVRQINAILKAAVLNKHVTELTLCGITIEEDSEKENTPCVSLRQQLAELLMTRQWKRLTFTSCSGDVLSALSTAHTILVDSLRVKSCPLQRHEAVALAHHLRTNSCLTHLELCEVDISNTMPPLARGIAASISLQTLEFNYCRWTNNNNNNVAMKCLASEGLAHNKSLTTLNLPGCELEDQTIRLLVEEGIAHHSTLKHLKLFRNHCGEEGVTALAKMLARGSDDKTQLESLDLSYQQFERAGKLNVEILATSLRNNTTIKNLALSFNKLNDDDAECLAVGLKANKDLVELDLRANNIRDKGAAVLAEEVVMNAPKLRKFCLYGNPLGEQGAKSLLVAIRKNTELVAMNMDYSLSVYDETQYYAYLNQVGRRLLKEQDFNPALWTVVMERAKRLSLDTRGVCTAADLIFPFVRDPAVFGAWQQSKKTR
jgi:Ran GTPase-activating protein (RanGAP) involved in mRNA processing and transport